jgi:isopenicillin N synthase-like dioxygenase
MYLDGTEIPVVDLSPFLTDGNRATCEVIAEAVRNVGVVIVRDPRIPEGLPGKMRDLFHRFYQSLEIEKYLLELPDTHHQIGWTPSYTEGARERLEERARLSPGNEAHPHAGKDPKERYSIPVGPPPERTAFPEYNQKTGKVPPRLKGEWEPRTIQWGNVMLDAVRTVVEMASIGMNCRDSRVFTRLLEHGPHLLAPTGTDLLRYSNPGTVHAGFHTDMGFATIHGRSNYPGLYVWTRDLRRIPARLPDDGCLLLQVGKQWQICTGGVAHAGFHEVVATDELKAKVDAERKAHRERQSGALFEPWRVSLTLFSHVASDFELKPYDVFDTPEAREKYPPILAGARMRRQLTRSGLASMG